jgi:hypothetical protein
MGSSLGELVDSMEKGEKINAIIMPDGIKNFCGIVGFGSGFRDKEWITPARVIPAKYPVF